MMDVTIDQLVMLIGQQTVELAALRGQLAEAQAALRRQAELLAKQEETPPVVTDGD
jgi:uncharacterized membrane protein